jgi:hypothetical protein
VIYLLLIFIIWVVHLICETTDRMALTYRREFYGSSIPDVCVEAACAVPMICTDDACLSAFVAGSGAVMTIPGADPDVLTDAMISMFQEVERYTAEARTGSVQTREQNSPTRLMRVIWGLAELDGSR